MLIEQCSADLSTDDLVIYGSVVTELVSHVIYEVYAKQRGFSGPLRVVAWNGPAFSPDHYESLPPKSALCVLTKMKVEDAVEAASRYIVPEMLSKINPGSRQAVHCIASEIPKEYQ